MPLLEIDRIEVAYGKTVAVTDVTLRVEKHDSVCLIGANGAGKTTILKTVVGLLRPNSGSIVFDNETIAGLHPADIVAKGVTLVPEGRRIFSDLSVEDNLIIGCYLRWNRKTISRKMDRITNLFPILAKRQSQIAGTLSGGEQQMLAIARALMSEPRLLLLDEPSMGLAPIIVRNVFEKISEVRSMGTTILLVEQNAKMALQYSREGYVIENGKVIMHGKSRDLIDHETVKRAYLGTTVTDGP